MKRILVIEDDEMLNAGLCYNLQMEVLRRLRHLEQRRQKNYGKKNHLT